MQLRGEKHQPPCSLAHDLVNKLSAIIGFCDLLVEKAEQQDAECVNRLTSIHALAASAAKQLTDHQCELSVLIRITKPATSHFV
jgi:light-regulated signal transduction histidine kinase (bacteriophytochrome)